MVTAFMLAAATVVQDYAYDPSRVVTAANASMGGYSRYAADAIGDGAAFDPRVMAASDEKWFWGLLIAYVIWAILKFVREERNSASSTHALAIRATSNAGLEGAEAERIWAQGEFRELKDPDARQKARKGWRPDLAAAQRKETLRAKKAEEDYSAEFGREPKQPKGKGGKNKKKKKG